MIYSPVYATTNPASADFKPRVPPEQVCEWRSPEQLKELLDLELRDEGESESKTLQRCRDAIKYSVKTSKSNFNELRSKHRGISSKKRG